MLLNKTNLCINFRPKISNRKVEENKIIGHNTINLQEQNSVETMKKYDDNRIII